MLAINLVLSRFLKALTKNFIVEKKGTEAYAPKQLHEFSLYLDANWYSLKAKEGTYDIEVNFGVYPYTITLK